MIGDPSLDRNDYIPIGYVETALSGATVASIPGAMLSASGLLLGVVHYTGGPFRFRLDATPTATTGWPAADGDTEYLNHAECHSWRACLAQGATSGTVRVGLYVKRR